MQGGMCKQTERPAVRQSKAAAALQLLSASADGLIKQVVLKTG